MNELYQKNTSFLFEDFVDVDDIKTWLKININSKRTNCREYEEGII